MTEWREFRSPDFDQHQAASSRRPVIFDGRNLYDPVVPGAARHHVLRMDRGAELISAESGAAGDVQLQRTGCVLSLQAEHAYPVILSGGSGTRLWPLSRELYPKQLLPLLSERHDAAGHGAYGSRDSRTSALPSSSATRRTVSWSPSSCVGNRCRSQVRSFSSPSGATPLRRLR